MPINSTKLGPGSLTLGAGAMEVNAQLRAANVTPAEAVEETDPIRVLSGDVLDGSSTQTYSFTLGGTFLQDLGAVASVVDWSWANMGTEQAFEFVPNTAAGRAVSGLLIPVPLVIGGDDPEGAPMQSDFTWRIVGTPDWDVIAP